jgi:hypothetical protein
MSMASLATDRARLLELETEQWRRKCRRSFAAFATEVLDGRGERLANHHKLICRKLMGLVAGELRAGDRLTVLRRLMLLMPPGSGKTTFVSHLFPAWFMALRPGCKVVALSHIDTFAEANSLTVQQTVREYAELLGFNLASDARGEWHGTNGSHYIAASVGATVRGRRADLLLLDDPIRDRRDAESETKRADLWR